MSARKETHAWFSPGLLQPLDWLLLAVWIVAGISGDGECNWLEGVQLLSVYLLIAIHFFFLPKPGHPQTDRELMIAGSVTRILNFDLFRDT
jgi:hypothetical protein